MFILATDVDSNAIYTGQGATHPGLLGSVVHVLPKETHWIREDLCLKNGETLAVKARIRYRQPLEHAMIHQFDNGLFVVFEKPQSAITEGQFVAWYLEDELIGSGVISL